VFSNYRPIQGVYDELVHEDGTIRPIWNDVIQRLDAMGMGQLLNRRQQALAQIARDGVSFNPHDSEGQTSRPWLLDALPLVLAEAEWKQVSEKLAQRASLMEAILADLYGPQRLIKERVIPPRLLFGHPAWHPAYSRLYSSVHRYLQYYVADIARASDGTWRVVGDRTKSPFGLGYVLENRIVTSRMLSPIFRKMPVRKLAPFYAMLKDELRSLAPRTKENPRIVLWTKGPLGRSYFEDAYLARYLGYTLAEGGDLSRRGGVIQLKTLGGLLPVEVLFRRIDDDDCDPVELRSSEYGVPGLLDVVRNNMVAVTNSIGSRLVESPVFLPFLPDICRFLLKEDLKLPSVRTWWCGDEEQKQYVINNLDNLSIRPAFRMLDEPPFHPQSLTEESRADLIRKMNAAPEEFVAQETIERSTTPVLMEGRVEPWHLALRTYLVSTDEGYKTLPGALARVSRNSEALSYTMKSGERSQDVWIIAKKHENEISLLEPSTTQVLPRRSGSELPSRVADNLYWLGRYIERAEQIARLMRAVFETLESENAEETHYRPMLRVLAENGHIDPDYVIPEFSRRTPAVIDVLPTAMFDTQKPLGLRTTINSAVFNAVRVRDRISPDMWRTIDRIQQTVDPNRYDSQLRNLDVISMLDRLLADFASFAGLIAENMTRTLGWRFLDLGVRIERSMQINNLVRIFFASERNEEPATIEAILRITNSLMTYRTRYLATFQVPVVLDLLITDVSNPRSIAFQLAQVTEHLNAMPRDELQALLTPEQRLGLTIASLVKLADIYVLAEVSRDGRRIQLEKLAKRLEEHLPKLSDAVSGRYLTHAGPPRHFSAKEKST